MATAQKSTGRGDRKSQEVVTEDRYETWAQWPISWSAVWAGALASISAVLILGLIGIAVGAHLLGPADRVVDLKTIGLGTLAYSVFSAFLAFVIGGWVTGKVAGILRSEPAMLHGGVSWLVAVPLLVGLTTLGAGSLLGGWYAGLSAAPAWSAPGAAPFERPETPVPSATEEERARYATEMAEYHRQVGQWREDTPRATRNAALGAVTALLLGLIGSVLGGWLASGEPMTFTHYRTRTVVKSGVS